MVEPAHLSHCIVCFHYGIVCFDREKELGDVEKLKDPNVKNFLEQQQSFEAVFTKEQVRITDDISCFGSCLADSLSYFS